MLVFDTSEVHTHNGQINYVAKRFTCNILIAFEILKPALCAKNSISQNKRKFRTVNIDNMTVPKM